MIRHQSQFRALRPGDRSALVSLTSWVGENYPGGATWLDNRINDVLLGRATGIMVEQSGTAVGLAIDTPKGCKRHKLSTFYVLPSARNRGVGSEMMIWLNQFWTAKNALEVFVTFDSQKVALANHFSRWGFTSLDLDRDRYKSGRSEAIYSWDPTFGENLASSVH